MLKIPATSNKTNKDYHIIAILLQSAIVTSHNESPRTAVLKLWVATYTWVVGVISVGRESDSKFIITACFV